MGDPKEYQDHRIIIGSTRTGMSQGYRFVATVEGGIGPDVWDDEIEVTAPSIRDALDQVERHIEGGTVTSIEQVE